MARRNRAWHVYEVSIDDNRIGQSIVTVTITKTMEPNDAREAYQTLVASIRGGVEFDHRCQAFEALGHYGIGYPIRTTARRVGR